MLISVPTGMSFDVHLSCTKILSFNESDYTFIIFTDPQFGKADRKAGGDGTNWEADIRHMNEMCDNLTTDQEKNHAFIICTGDMAEALPVDEGQENLGRLPGIRPGETSEFFDTMRNCPKDLPFFTLNGNRDIGNHIFAEHAWKGYEKQFMDRLFHCCKMLR